MWRYHPVQRRKEDIEGTVVRLTAVPAGQQLMTPEALFLGHLQADQFGHSPVVPVLALAAGAGGEALQLGVILTTKGKDPKRA